jgi:hypothetical protein
LFAILRRRFSWSYRIHPAFLVEVEPAKYIQRLVAFSLLSETEIPEAFYLVNGLYLTGVRTLRIMADPAVYSRFVLGDWPGTFQLSYLSLYHFLSISRIGFDYFGDASDLFTSFRNFILWCTWLFGDHWQDQFTKEIAMWQRSHPWTSFSPFVLHVAFERALSSWFAICRSHGSAYHYRTHESGLEKLREELVSSWIRLD